MDIIKNWEKKLLDLSRRNNLLVFKDTKQSTLEVISPSLKEVFLRITEGKKNYLMALDKKLELSKEETLNLYEPKRKKDAFLMYSSYESPLSNVKTIGRYNKLFFDEKGLNILYMAFGFLRFIYQENTYLSPILLVPLTLASDSKQDPFYVKEADDDIIVNPTLSYFLELNLGISLPSFNEDIDRYFEEMKENLSKENFEIIYETKMALFQFQKISMYHDLLENEEAIINHPIVGKFMGYQGLINPNIDKNVTLNPVIDCDSSQIEAMRLAKNKVSFVLEGPPGTGKSQTITNIIAEALRDHKHVLFVSEKKAALDVVYKNLSEVGLGDYALPLHGDKTSKKGFIDALYQTLEKGSQKLTNDVSLKQQVYLDTLKDMNQYVENLHTQNDLYGISFYELINELVSFRHLTSPTNLFLDMKNKGMDFRKEGIKAIGKMNTLMEVFGYDILHSPFSSLKKVDLSFNSKNELKSLLKETVIAIMDLRESLDRVNSLLSSPIDNLSLALYYSDILEAFQTLLLDESYFDLAFIQKEALLSKQLIANTLIVKKVKEELDQNYMEDIFLLDGRILKEEVSLNYHSFLKRCFSKRYKEIKETIEKASRNGKCNYSKVLEVLNQLAEYESNQKEIKEKDHFQFVPCYQGLNTDFDLINCLLEKCEKAYAVLGAFNSDLLEKEEFVSIKQSILTIAKNLNPLNTFFDNTISFKKDSFDSLIMKLKTIIEKEESWDLWNQVLDTKEELKKLGILDFYQNLINQETNQVDLLPAFIYTWDLGVKEELIKDNENHLTRKAMDDLVEEYKRLDQWNLEYNRCQTVIEISGKIPSIDNQVTGSPSNIILREHEKVRKQKSIYSLMHLYPETILDLKPCFLMSPLSVSTYIDSKKISFDLVIFDEASQVFPEDAIGAIYRSKQVIVVGDSKQMPPSNFFNAQNFDEDETNEEGAFESILDLCNASLMKRSLMFHYRSRVEDLITFSNQSFYGGKLVSFPSTFKKKPFFGVSFHYVPNGTYDTLTRTNLEEANAICDLIYEAIEKYPNRSLGVVSFSRQQETLIKKTLQKKREENPIYEDFFDENKKDPFFIKNLETIQGDERDTIIFSICYGYDKDHHFRQNFGPLQIVGGERRLNVAITRSKYSLEVVSSINPSDIDASKNKNLGPKLLSDYLAYAISLNQERIETKEDTNDQVIEEIAEFLEQEGYEVKKNVGSSHHPIELAVKKEDAYLFAVETDGLLYQEEKNSRDRNIVRESVLRRMGWNYYRVWSIEWLNHKELEKERLIKALSNEAVKPLNRCSNMKLELTKEEEIPLFDTYIEMPLHLSEKTFSKEINRLIRQETPISKKEVMEKTLDFFGRKRLNPNVIKMFDSIYEPDKDIGLEGGFYYTPGSIYYPLRARNNTRKIKEISPYELANGLYKAIKHSGQVKKEDLFRFIAHELGGMLTEEATASLESALLYLGKNISIRDDLIVPLEKERLIKERE